MAALSVTTVSQWPVAPMTGRLLRCSSAYHKLGTAGCWLWMYGLMAISGIGTAGSHFSLFTLRALPPQHLHRPLCKSNKNDSIGDPPTWSLAPFFTVFPFLNSPPRNSRSMISYFNVKVSTSI